jgi:hypothetical protein
MKFQRSAFLSVAAFTPLSVEGASVECKLYQLNAPFPDGGHGNRNSPIDDNEGWRGLFDDADFSTYCIEGLPPDFLKKLI